jgi:F-type H+-transporting ATPase subunit epsilon
MHVRVVSPEAVVFEGQATGLVAPAWDGRVGVLPGHAPMIALLGVGVLDIDVPGGGSHQFHVAGGVLKVVDDQVTMLTEYAGSEPPETVPEGARIDPDDVIESSAVAGNPLV